MLLRDPVHGDIEFTAAECAVINLPEMQRLRGIKQLGTAYLVYPGAVHSRFEHSLGVCAVARRMVRFLTQAGFRECAEFEQAVCLAALLHDITHVPFGHTLEDERRLFPRHDKGQRLAHFLNGAVGETLARFGERERVGALLGENNGTPVPKWAQQVVSGAIDADLLDYLRRDSFFTGVSHGYDDRILRCFALLEDELVIRLVKHGFDRSDARSEAISVLRLRYFLTERVYYHHTKVVAGALISKAVEQALQAGKLSEKDLLTLNDWTLLEYLQRCGVPSAQLLAQRTAQRNLLKRAYGVSGEHISAALQQDWVTRYHEQRQLRAAAERAIAADLGVSFEDVVVYCPALTVMKEASVPVETRHGLQSLNHPDSPAYAELSALEERYAGLWRFYVFVPEAQVSRALHSANEFFGVPSEFQSKTR